MMKSWSVPKLVYTALLAALAGVLMSLEFSVPMMPVFYKVDFSDVPAVIAQITTQLGACGVNVENMTNKSKGEYAYTMVDAGSQVDESIIEDIRRAPGVIRMRVI